MDIMMYFNWVQGMQDIDYNCYACFDNQQGQIMLNISFVMLIPKFCKGVARECARIAPCHVKFLTTPTFQASKVYGLCPQWRAIHVFYKKE